MSPQWTVRPCPAAWVLSELHDVRTVTDEHPPDCPPETHHDHAHFHMEYLCNCPHAGRRHW